uniref:RIKEN cDNA A330070K13 gene n=1 Tax=Mus spicilegus TaxID=10103 RepID=A0A8C6HR75_MUSSI
MEPGGQEMGLCLCRVSWDLRLGNWTTVSSTAHAKRKRAGLPHVRENCTSEPLRVECQPLKDPWVGTLLRGLTTPPSPSWASSCHHLGTTDSSTKKPPGLQPQTRAASLVQPIGSW